MSLIRVPYIAVIVAISTACLFLYVGLYQNVFLSREDYKGALQCDVIRSEYGRATLDLCEFGAVSDTSVIMEKPVDALLKSGNLHWNSSTETAIKARWRNVLLTQLPFPMDPGYGSHVIPLLASFWITDGDILELGSGWYSTPMAHTFSINQDRTILTADTNQNWLQKLTIFKSRLHHFMLVSETSSTGAFAKTVNPSQADEVKVTSSWDLVGANHSWSVVFVDHAPGLRRPVDLQRLRGHSELLVTHDTDGTLGRVYKLEEVLASFRHRYSFRYPSWSARFTDVVSDNRKELVEAVRVLTEMAVEILDIDK